HTRFSRDWSSDVCSSDLGEVQGGAPKQSATFHATRSARGRTDGFVRTLHFLVELFDGARWARMLVELRGRSGPSPAWPQSHWNRSEERRVGKEGKASVRR